MAGEPGRPVSALLVSTTLATGGAQRFTSTLLGHLDRERVRPALCLLRREVGYPLPSDVAVTSFRYRRIWHGPHTVRALRRLLRESRPDLVLSNITASNLICGLALRPLRRRPAWIARIGSSPAHLDGRLRAWLARRAYPPADLFVVNSPGLAGALESFYPLTRGRVEVLATPTDFEQLERLAAEPPIPRPPASGPLLIAVGRLFPEKRYDLMLEVLARVRRSVPARLWICGEGPERGALERLAEGLGVASAVWLPGFCPNPFALMRQADLFLMTSDHEGLPNSLIEAQGLGLAAVSTRCPHGPEEIVDDGSTGILTPVGDVTSTAEAVLSLLTDPERRRRMAAAARSTARARFAATPLTRAWEDRMLDCVRRRAP